MPRSLPSLSGLRHLRPTTDDGLWNWVRAYTGVAVARTAACRGHHAPFDAFAHQVLRRPSEALWLGSRGSGKSFLSAIDTHLASRFRPNHGTRILGGSKAQSQQIYEALRSVVLDGKGPLGSDGDTLAKLLETRAAYRNGSDVSILACSSTSVRGPHIPSLKLDEVDEIDPDLRESSLGMCMNRGADRASVLMTSTWHKVGGPMAGLIERAEAGAFPLFRFCAFEVLERCPAERSGPGLEKCPECPLVRWCHDTPDGVPKAKRSAGHYAIDALIQKTANVSLRTFEADYLCLGPKADGLWFPRFDTAKHVTPEAEYDPALPVHVAIDSGVFTGAVFFQTREDRAGLARVNVFADYLAEDVPAEANARAVLEVARTRCNGRLDRRVTDPAGNARNAIGPTVMAEYARAGLPCEPWPIGSIADGLALIEAFLEPADGGIGLTIHPRCRHLIDAFKGYRRAKRQGQWQDHPADPAHPEEDLMDALRGGLRARFPEGRKPQPKLMRTSARRVF